MEKKTKGWISKLFTFALLAAIIVQILYNVNPIHSDGYRSDGVCNITNFYWVEATCMRDDTFYFLYNVPVVAGIFVELDGRPDVLPGTIFNNVTSQYYEALFLNNSYHKNTAEDYNRAILYDDHSDNPPLNCTSADIVSTKQLLLQYLPILQGVLDVNSTTVNTLSYYPDSYFNCTSNHLSGFSAFIDYQRSIKLLIIPFVVTMLAFIGGLCLITKYDIDGPIKEFATFLLQILFMGVYLANYIFFVIIRVIIGQFVFNVSPGEPIDFLKAGSIFFPLVWLYKKGREEWRKRQTASAPPTSAASPQTRVTAQTDNPRVSPPPNPRSNSTPSPPLNTRRHSASTPPLNTRRHSASTPPLNTRPHAPPPSIDPPSYQTIDTEGTVIRNNVVLQYHGEEGFNNDDILPPPPTYDDAVSHQM